MRSTLRAVQTPQIFKISILKQAYELLQKQHGNVTDDASLVERLGIAVAVAEGSYENIKITTPIDFYTFKAYLEVKNSLNIMGL